MNKLRIYRLKVFLFVLVSFFPLFATAQGVDAGRAGMFATFAASASATIYASNAVLTINAGEHIMSKEEVDKVVTFQKQFNNYLTDLSDILTYAAEGYAIFCEVDEATKNISELTSFTVRCPTNAIAVALSKSKNHIYNDVIDNGLQIANDVKNLLSLNKDKDKNAKMTEKERIECIGNIRRSLRNMNRKLRKMNLMLRYTTLMDSWYELRGRYYRPRSMQSICKDCQQRWAKNARVWKN